MERTLADLLTLAEAHLWAFDREKIRAALTSGHREGLKAAFEQADGGLEQAWSALFEGTDAAVQIPLWESAYPLGRKSLLDGHTLSVVREYYAQGVQPANPSIPPDELGYETEFMGFLLAEAQWGTLERFWREHYAPLLSGFCAAVEEQLGENGYFAALAGELLDGVRRVSALLRTSRLEDGEKGEAALPPHFRPITPQEAEERLTERVILTSGRGNCGGKCVIRAHVTAGCVTQLESDMEDETTPTLRACARGRGYRRTYLSAERLRYPMLRTGERGEGKFRRISWDEAIDLMAQKLAESKARHGVGSRYVNDASGVTSVIRGDRLAKRLLALDGGFLDNYLTYSNAAAEVAIPYTYGTNVVRSSIASYRHAKLLILWGYNPIVTFYNHQMMELLRRHKERGTPIIVIDPQYSDTAAVFATKWLPIRPGTDSALASAMAYVLWERGLCDQGFMDRFCIGFDRAHMPAGFEGEESFRDYIYGLRDGVVKTPAWAAEITGIREEEIIDLACLYGSTKPAAILAGLGAQRHANGEQTVRSVMVLPCMTGNVGRPGGGTGARGQVRQHAAPPFPMPENPYQGSIPVFLWSAAITRGHSMTRARDRVRGREQLDSDIKFIFNLAGNTLINQHSDTNATAKLLRDTSKCEFIVVSDIFMTASAKFADLLLPGTSLFETQSLTPPWSEGNYLLWGNPVIPPLFEGRDEFDWFVELADRMGIENFSEGCDTLREWLNKLYDRTRAREPELPDFETFAAKGGYKYRNNPDFIAFQECVQDFDRHPFPTPSGKIEIFCPAIYDLGDPVEIPAIPKYVPEFEGVSDPKRAQYPLQLIGWHTKRRCHSVHDNNPWMEGVEPHRLWMHPEDAAPRHISEGDTVRVFNQRGTVKIPVHVSRRIMQGVVCIPQGAWFTPDKDGVDIRGCVNTLTTLRPSPMAMGNPQHTNLVEVAAEPEQTGR